jgi:hypothetical protein
MRGIQNVNRLPFMSISLSDMLAACSLMMPNSGIVGRPPFLPSQSAEGFMDEFTF